MAQILFYDNVKNIYWLLEILELYWNLQECKLNNTGIAESMWLKGSMEMELNKFLKQTITHSY